MDTRTSHAPGWLDPELWVEFLDELRLDGYKIGVEQYVAVQDLLLTLTAQGTLPELQQLGSLIGPIVCSSSSEQHDFQERFEQWADLVDQSQYQPQLSSEEQAEELSTTLETLTQRSKWLKRGLISAVTILIVPLILLYHPPVSIEELERRQQQLNDSSPTTTTAPAPASPTVQPGSQPASEPEIKNPVISAPPPPPPEFAPPLFPVNWAIYLLINPG